MLGGVLTYAKRKFTLKNFKIQREKKGCIVPNSGCFPPPLWGGLKISLIACRVALIGLRTPTSLV